MDGTVMRIITAQEGHYHAYRKMVPSLGASPYEIREDHGFGFLGMDYPLFAFSGGLSTMSITTADNRALARYNAKVADVNRQFQGGTFFGELAEALHGIRHPAEALFKGIEGYSIAATKLRRSFVKSKADLLSLSRNQRRKVARSFSDAATGLWLEKSFHWLPLMYDIQGAFSALTHTLDQVPRQFVKVSATDVVSKVSQVSSWVGPRFYDGYRTITDETSATVKYYGIVRVGPRSPFAPDLKALGFDLRSFVPTLWELIPYSWAVDYFTNVGDIIYGASYGGEDVVWTSRGWKKAARRTIISGLGSKASSPPPGWKDIILFGTMKQSEVATETAIISRAVYTGAYIPSLDYKIPGMSLKWLNLGAVFLQRSLAFL
jgi:hypothetical protein